MLKRILVITISVIMVAAIAFLIWYGNATKQYSDFINQSPSEIIKLAMHNKDSYDDYKQLVNEYYSEDLSQYDNCKVKTSMQIIISPDVEPLKLEVIIFNLDGSMSGTANVVWRDIDRTYYFFFSKNDAENRLFVNYQGTWYETDNHNKLITAQEIINYFYNFSQENVWVSYPKTNTKYGNGMYVSTQTKNERTFLDAIFCDNGNIWFDYCTTEQIKEDNFLYVAVECEDKIIQAYNRHPVGIQILCEVYDVGKVTIEDIQKPYDTQYVDSMYQFVKQFEEYAHITSQKHSFN